MQVRLLKMVHEEKMKQAVTQLAELILTIQGDGDKEKIKKLMAEKGHIGAGLQQDLDFLSSLGIPVDIVFEQGLDALHLNL